MRSLGYTRVPGTTKAIITVTRKTDLPCYEIGRLVAASPSKPNEYRCVCVALPLLTCRFLGQSFGGSSSCPHPRLTHRHAKPGGRRSPRSPRHRRAVGGAHPHINACGRTLANQVIGAARVGYNRTASTCVCHQGRISSSATRRGLIRSLMRLASRSSAFSGEAPACQGRRMALGPRSALRQSAAGKHR